MPNKECSVCQRVAELELMLIDVKFDRDCLIDEKRKLECELRKLKRENGKDPG